MNFRRQGGAKEPDFQVTPMVDLIFLVLSFFLSSQVFSTWETEIDVKLPTSESGAIRERLPGEVIVNVLADGSLVVNHQVLTDRQLRQLFDRIVKLFPGQPVLLRADRGTAYEHVIRVLDICRRADIWNISFATSFAKESLGP
jgi:biopolymer transport protein ExbD